MSDLEFLGFANDVSTLDPIMYQYFNNLLKHKTIIYFIVIPIIPAKNEQIIVRPIMKPNLVFSFFLTIDETNTPKESPAKEPTIDNNITKNILLP